MLTGTDMMLIYCKQNKDIIMTKNLNPNAAEEHLTG